MAIVQAAFGDVEIHEWGHGQRVIVALHAAASGPRALTRLAERLAAEGWRVVVPALSGYGATSARGGDSSIAANVAIARFCLDRAGAGRRVLFGHSFGGLIALRTAVLAAPACEVIAYEPVAFGALDLGQAADRDALAWDRSIAETLVANVDAGEPERGVAAFIEAWNESAWDALPEALRRTLVAGAETLKRDVLAVTQDQMAAGDYASLGDRLALIRGARSPTAVRLIAERLHDAVSGSRLVDLARGGHMAPALQADAVAEALAELIGA